jgi:hypothetical protein
MGPNPHDGPAGIDEPTVSIAIACDVAFDLCAPPLAIVFGPGSMFGAPVPKAAIDEHSGLRSGKDNVDGSATSRQNSTMEAEAKAAAVQRGTKGTLARIVSLSRSRHPLGGGGRDRIAELNIFRHFSCGI